MAEPETGESMLCGGRRAKLATLFIYIYTNSASLDGSYDLSHHRSQLVLAHIPIIFHEPRS
jgi:hypothetical protein